MQRRWWQILLLVLLVVVLVWTGSGEDSDPAPEPTATASAAPDDAFVGLPPQVAETVELIDAGGPFPYDRDGVVFENRERLLPQHPRGYYREYTVPTPGADDRGARRLVEGEAGELYYTDDHYASFEQIREGP